MHGAVDLSNLKTKEATIDNLTEEQREAVEKLAEENAPEGHPVTTAFLVVIEGGDTYVNPDLDAKFIRDRMPTADDMYGAVTTIAKDLQAQESAQLAVLNFQAMMQAQMSAMQNSRLAQGLNL